MAILNGQSDLVQSWIALQKADHDSSEYKTNEWSALQLNMMCISEPDAAWKLLVEIFESSSDPWIYENLGAGPLETLLTLHSDFALDAIKKYSEANPAFLDAAAYVWQHSLPPDVAERFVAIASKGK